MAFLEFLLNKKSKSKIKLVLKIKIMQMKIIGMGIIVSLVLISSQKIAAQKPPSNLPPNAIAATTNGYSMTAKINGKEYKAAFMMPPEETEQIVGFYNGDKYIGLPYDKKYFVVGKKISFSDHHVDLTTNDDVKVWDGSKGEMEITKVTGDWVEGKFYFTGYSYDNKKSIEVTNGFFRISLKK